MANNRLLLTEQVTKLTYDTLAEEWAQGHSTTGFWQAEMQRYQELLPSGKILEVGAGGGRDAKELVKLGYDYVGTDVSSGFLEVARKQLPENLFLEQSVYDLDFGGEEFDGFWASAVLLHIPKSRIDEALERIRTVIRNGAVGFISIKDGNGEIMEVDEIGDKRLGRLFCYWLKDDFIEHLTRTGYRVADYSYRPMTKKTKWHCFYVVAV